MATSSTKKGARSKNKLRADELIFKKKLVESRSKAQACIIAGWVEYRNTPDEGWKRVEKAGQALSLDCEFQIHDPHRKDVGRGAIKLRKAFNEWSDLLRAKSFNQALDIGSSTGGFTQVLLEEGVKSVVALDVGTHQLHERLRRDPRVISLEQQHVLKVDEAVWERIHLKPCFQIIVTDVSFISVRKIAPLVASWLEEAACWILLFKPQFELTPADVPRGIVRNEETRQRALRDFLTFMAENVSALESVGYTESPISGAEGNKEFLLCFQKKK